MGLGVRTGKDRVSMLGKIVEAGLGDITCGHAETSFQ